MALKRYLLFDISLFLFMSITPKISQSLFLIVILAVTYTIIIPILLHLRVPEVILLIIIRSIFIRILFLVNINETMLIRL